MLLMYLSTIAYSYVCRHLLTQVGVLAQIKSITRQADGTLLVAYEGSRRFQILSMLADEPHGVAYAMRLSDLAPESPQRLADLEMRVRLAAHCTHSYSIAR
jgi:Lon protease-like protein